MQVGQESIQDLENDRSATHSKDDQLMIPHASMRKRRSSIEHQPPVGALTEKQLCSALPMMNCRIKGTETCCYTS